MKYLFTLFVIILSITSTAQTRFSQSTGRAYAYSQRSSPGMVMKDDEGNIVKPKIDYKYKIYIETKGTVLPQWGTAWINGKSYFLTSSKVNGKIHVGKREGSERMTVIYPRKGYQMWEHIAEPTDPGIKPKLNRTQKEAAVVLQATFRNSPVLFSIHRITRLEPVEYK